MFENAEKGDRVWWMNRGWAVIKKTSYEYEYPIVVEVEEDDGEEGTFTIDGKYYAGDIYPTLFWDKVPIPESAKIKPEPKFHWVYRSRGFLEVSTKMTREKAKEHFGDRLVGVVVKEI